MDTPIITPTKRCTKCGNEYPVTTQYFGRRASAPDGFTFACKACKSAHDKQYNQNNAEKIAVAKRNRYIQDKERISASRKEYRVLNRDRINKNTEQWRRTHPDARAQYRRDNLDREKENQRNHRQRFPEKHRADEARRRARKLGAGGTYTRDDILHQLQAQKGRCWWCEAKVGDKYHVDHLIPLARGGSNDARNIVISCPKCNMSKNDKLPSEWSDRLL